MNKKILIVTGIIALFLIILGSFWFFGDNDTEQPNNAPNDPFGTPANDIIGRENTDYFVGGSEGASNLQITERAGLRNLSMAPVSGGAFLSQNGSSTKIRFVERATGHVFEADLLAGVVSRITNTTIPKVYEAIWNTEGNSFIARQLEEGVVKTSVIQINSQVSTTTPENFLNVSKTDLPDNILSIDYSPDGNNIFYLVRGLFGAEGFISNQIGANANLVWESPINGWLVAWATQNEIFLNTKASNGIDGVLQKVNRSGNASVVLSGYPGLTSKPSAENILFTANSSRNWQTFLHNTGDDVSVGLPFETLPEKCVWENEISVICGVPTLVSPNAPDDWYQGVFSFNDEMWRIDLETGETSKISDLTAGDYRIDVINPTLSPDGSSVIFMNKKDLSLWLLPLN